MLLMNAKADSITRHPYRNLSPCAERQTASKAKPATHIALLHCMSLLEVSSQCEIQDTQFCNGKDLVDVRKKRPLTHVLHCEPPPA
eukprot:3817820-Amphidinium_carterae.1